MKSAVVVFPGSNCDQDCWNVLRDVAKVDVEYVWHKQKTLPKVDLVVLPGGFSYGDYLRTGAIAKFSPIMQAVTQHAKEGRAVIGICNGFQILLEAGLLPGAMLRNRTLKFICKHVYLRTETEKTIFTNRIKPKTVLNIPIAHGEGNYYCDRDTLRRLQDNGQIVFRYASEDGKVSDASNPNGSLDSIAGIVSEAGNVLGMMPHPERASEDILSSTSGRGIWESLKESLN